VVVGCCAEENASTCHGTNGACYSHRSKLLAGVWAVTIMLCEAAWCVPVPIWRHFADVWERLPTAGVHAGCLQLHVARLCRCKRVCE
jgi:hypothetical protein